MEKEEGAFVLSYESEMGLDLPRPPKGDTPVRPFKSFSFAALLTHCPQIHLKTHLTTLPCYIYVVYSEIITKELIILL